MDQHDGDAADAIEAGDVLVVGGDDPSVRGARAGKRPEKGASVHEISVGFGG